MKKFENYFTNTNAIKTIDTFRVIYFVIAFIWFLITEAGRNIYRPFIYTNNINDYGIADSIGNSGGIIVQIFFTLAIINSPRKKATNIFILLVGGYILYEIVQPYLPRGVFDWKDIYGTLIGGLIAFIIFLILHKVIKKNKVYHKF